MGDLTKNLSRREFACQCGCGFDTADVELVKVLQECVDYFGDNVRIQITGPNRCVEHNASVGGASNSQHIYARAADFKIFIRFGLDQVDPDEVADYFEALYSDQLWCWSIH